MLMRVNIGRHICLSFSQYVLVLQTLDLLITRDDQSVAVLPVDPPLLSDHAFVVADCSCPLPPSTTLTACRQLRNWRGLDVDAFDAYLQQAPALDPTTAFRCYDQTLQHLLDHPSPSECL